MTDFDEHAKGAGDRVRRRASELAAARGVGAGLGPRRAAGQDARRDRRWVAVAAAAAVVVIGVGGLIAVTIDGSQGDMTDDGTGPTLSVLESLPPSSTPEPTPTPTVEVATPATSTDVSTTLPAQPLRRPIIDPAICTPVFARVGPTFEPFGPLTLFARPSEFPVPIQVIGNPELGPAGPFAIVLRYQDSSRAPSGDVVDINGFPVGIATHPNGNGEASWDLIDGSQGYLRSRGLSRDEIVAIVASLTPRDPDAPVGGFDYGGDGPIGFEILHERMNTQVSEGSTSSSQCTIPGATVGYSVSILTGDPVYEFGGVIDRPAPLSVGMRDGVVLVISGPDLPDAPTVDDVIEADDALWDELRTADVIGGPRVEPIGGDLEVTADLVTFAGGDGGQLTFKLKEFEGVTFLEVYKNDAVVSEDGVYWVEEIDGRRRAMTSAPGGGVWGTRLGDSPLTEPFTVEVFVIDGDDLVLQTTGEIMLVPQT